MKPLIAARLLVCVSLVYSLVVSAQAEEEKDTSKLKASLTVFDTVNQIRQRRGLKPFLMDRALMEQAQATSMVRAKKKVAGHLRGWQGLHAKSEGCGTSQGCDLEGRKFITCCLFEKWTYAGVGCAHLGGRTYYTLLVR